MDYRHEWKHEISFQDMLTLRQRLQAVMRQDAHAQHGSYFIRSLYFDNAVDKVLREKLDGVNCREKFRIRYYNHDPSVIHLEKKSKRNGLGCKQMVPVSLTQIDNLLKGDWDWMAQTQEPLIAELYLKMKSQGLRPKNIVDYTREPFVYAPGNVRVTLDYDIRTGLQSKDFLNPDCVTIPVADDPILLEVKWDAFLPDVIRDIVQLPGRHTAAFSKYAVCRMYD